MAYHVVSLRRDTSVAFGLKRTSAGFYQYTAQHNAISLAAEIFKRLVDYDTMLIDPLSTARSGGWKVTFLRTDAKDTPILLPWRHRTLACIV
jgi:hypothetical protein